MVMTTLASAPMLWREGRMVLGLLALALFLAILGRWTADSRLPAVVLGNLLAGFALFALSCRLLLAASARPRSIAAAERGWVQSGAGAVLLCCRSPWAGWSAPATPASAVPSSSAATCRPASGRP